MMDIFSSALATARTASDIGKSLLELRDAEKVRAAVFDLRNQLMDLQERMLEAKEEQMRLLGRVAELEQELSCKEEAANRRARYQRHQFETGDQAYMLKEEFQGEEKPHYLCSLCFEKGEFITLHGKDKGLTCPSCKTEIRATPRKPVSIHRRNSV